MDTGQNRPFISVKFTSVGRAITFLLPDLEFDPLLAPGEPVVVQMGESRAYGAVTRTVPEIAARKAPAGSTQQVMRRATQEDVVARLKHQHRERAAQRICLLKIRELGLPMKLTKVEQLFDGSRLIFYFTADGRVDFRELVRELAAEFRVRIEMRQLGARDEAQVIGWLWHVRPAAVLYHLAAVVRADFHQDGQAAGPQPQSVTPLRLVRPAEVLLAL